MAGVEFDLLSLIRTIRFWIISSTTATGIRHLPLSNHGREIPNVYPPQEDKNAQNSHLIPPMLGIIFPTLDSFEIHHKNIPSISME
jgi:hypothetical protein